MRHDLRQPETSGADGSLLVLALLALLVGAAAGLVGSVFRALLARAEHLRDLAVARADGIIGAALIVIVCAAATAFAAWLVRRFSPHASGSGIPHVEAVLHGEIPPAPLSLLPVKFVGGLLAIGSGLALGREGPSVQMGANLATIIGRLFNRPWPDCRVLLAAGAGAGLATAFNSPIGGAVFVLEELVQKFEHRVAIAALAASTTAIAVEHLMLGNQPDFHVAALSNAAVATLPLFIALGAVAGALAVAYNRALLAALAVAQRLGKFPAEARAGAIGAAVGLLALIAPGLVGGGDVITQRTLEGGEAAGLVAVAFLVRFALGPISYAAGTPGGLFAPLLVLGAQAGLLFGQACHFAFPALGIQPEAFAIVGMAAFFTGVVRAPITGIVLVTEMTASVTTLPPMLGACFAAMLLPMLLRNEPIYESLREHTLRCERAIRKRRG